MFSKPCNVNGKTIHLTEGMKNAICRSGLTGSIKVVHEDKSTGKLKLISMPVSELQQHINDETKRELSAFSRKLLRNMERGKVALAEMEAASNPADVTPAS